MTAPIRSSQALAEALRVQLTALSSAPAAATARAQMATAKGGQTQRKMAEGRTQQGLPAALLRRTAALDAADPDRRRKAVRLFLEAALLSEWGAGLINDPAFQHLVDDVCVQMEGDATLAPLMEQAADQLLAGAGAAR